MNKENIKKAFDLFQDDKYVESKEILQKEISDHRNSYFYNKLGLEESVINESDDFEVVDDFVNNLDLDNDDEYEAFEEIGKIFIKNKFDPDSWSYDEHRFKNDWDEMKDTAKKQVVKAVMKWKKKLHK